VSESQLWSFFIYSFSNQSTNEYLALLRCDVVSLSKSVPGISKENSPFVFKGILNISKPITQ